MCFLNQVPVAIYGFDPDTKERVRLHLDFVAFIISPNFHSPPPGAVH